MSYTDLLEIYWDRLGDGAVARPRAVGNDRGPQYRPASTRFPSKLAAAEASLAKRQERARSPSRRKSSRQPASSGPRRSTTSGTEKGGQSAKKRETEPIRCYG